MSCTSMSASPRRGSSVGSDATDTLPSGMTLPAQFKRASLPNASTAAAEFVVTPDLNQYGWFRIHNKSEFPSASARISKCSSSSTSSATVPQSISGPATRAPTPTVDENFMDLAYRLARNSYCIEGNMGCVFVRNIPVGSGGDTDPLSPPAQIVCQSVNTACFNPFHSDCHAEANAVAACAAHGQPLAGTTCYVTRAPCSECFKLLCMARVARIVCPQAPCSQKCADVVGKLSIEWVCIPDTKESSVKRDAECALLEDWEQVKLLRVERKRQRAMHRERKKKEKALRIAAEKSRREAKRKSFEMNSNCSTRKVVEDENDVEKKKSCLSISKP